jgi:3-oxoacyl-[acyl-carrier protein] reductase
VDQAVRRIADKGSAAIGEALDIADPQASAGWVRGAAEQLGGCDIFISFATGGGGAASEETWRRTYELDVLGLWRGVEAALPYLRASSAASVVAISSTAALEHFLAPQAYNAMKAAVINYAAELSQQLAPEGVRVNTISPGPVFVDGGSWDGVKQRNPELYERTVQQIPAGRMASAAEVARAIAFVASPACRSIVGANLVIDGGFTKRVQY